MRSEDIKPEPISKLNPRYHGKVDPRYYGTIYSIDSAEGAFIGNKIDYMSYLCKLFKSKGRKFKYENLPENEKSKIRNSLELMMESIMKSTACS